MGCGASKQEIRVEKPIPKDLTNNENHRIPITEESETINDIKQNSAEQEVRNEDKKNTTLKTRSKFDNKIISDKKEKIITIDKGTFKTAQNLETRTIPKTKTIDDIQPWQIEEENRKEKESRTVFKQKENSLETTSIASDENPEVSSIQKTDPTEDNQQWQVKEENRDKTTKEKAEETNNNTRCDIRTFRINIHFIAFIKISLLRFLKKIRFKRLNQKTPNEEKVKEHVLSIPDEYTESVEILSEYLTEPWSLEIDKAYAIFTWLSFNISYDIDGFLDRTEMKSCDANSVLHNRTSVCAGYANLFEALAKAAGFNVHIISGYSKSFGYKVGVTIEEKNHAWNAIQINGVWFLCDPTWGAGYIGDDLLFHQIHKKSKFLMDPEYAICNQFPEDEQWQLLEQPISMEEFQKLTSISEDLHLAGIKPISHKESFYTIEDSDSIEMIFYSPFQKILKPFLNNSLGNLEGKRAWTQIIPCGQNKVKLKCQFPCPDLYKLRLFVRIKETTWFHNGMDYLIDATKKVEKQRMGFPKLEMGFYEMGFYLDSPLENIITEDGKACIFLENYNSQITVVEGRLELEANKQKLKEEYDDILFCSTERTKKGFKIRVHCPLPGAYTLKIFANEFENENVLRLVCKYYIIAKDNVGPIAGFPLLSKFFEKWGLEFIEPQMNIYVPVGHTNVKIKNPREISINCNLMKGEKCLGGLYSTSTLNCLTTISVQIPEPGLFQLRIFGKEVNDKKLEYLATLSIMADNGSE